MNERFQKLCRDYKIQTAIDPRLYDKYNVKEDFVTTTEAVLL